MDKKNFQFFSDLLNERLKELTQRGDDTVSSLIAQDIQCADPLDQAALYTDQTFQLRIKDRESRLIKKIREALERISDGSFGICEICGEDISIGRLKARPVATQCIDCKTKAEMLEKVVGF